MQRTLSLHALVLCAGLSLVSCASSGPGREPDPVWRSTEVEAPSDRVLWKVALLAVEQADYPIAGGLDPSSMQIVSGWKTQLQPFRGEGNRTRAELRMERNEGDRWLVKARVQKQNNMALSSPLDPTRADWHWSPEDPVAAEVLLLHIVSLFAPDLETVDPAPAGSR